MNSIFRTALIATSILISFSSIAAPPKVSSAAAAAAAAKALEDQLVCTANPTPGKVIRTMLANGLLKETEFGSDGVPVLAATSDIYVYGKKVKFVSGWEMESDGNVKEPFLRGPGTAPPHFIAVSLDASPHDVQYTTQRIKKNANGPVAGPYSSIGQTNEDYDKSGTTITCYGH